MLISCFHLIMVLNCLWDRAEAFEKSAGGRAAKKAIIAAKAPPPPRDNRDEPGLKVWFSFCSAFFFFFLSFILFTKRSGVVVIVFSRTILLFVFKSCLHNLGPRIRGIRAFTLVAAILKFLAKKQGSDLTLRF